MQTVMNQRYDNQHYQKLKPYVLKFTGVLFTILQNNIIAKMLAKLPIMEHSVEVIIKLFTSVTFWEYYFHFCKIIT